jgi:hypothetical protein
VFDSELRIARLSNDHGLTIGKRLDITTVHQEDTKK